MGNSTRSTSMHSTSKDDDWTKVEDRAARRKIQNRRAQRRHSMPPHRQSPAQPKLTVTQEKRYESTLPSCKLKSPLPPETRLQQNTSLRHTTTITRTSHQAPGPASPLSNKNTSLLPVCLGHHRTSMINPICRSLS